MKKEQDRSRLVDIFEGQQWEAEIIKGLLESNGIQAETRQGIITSVAPYLSPTVTVMVREEQEPEAARIIGDKEIHRDKDTDDIYE